MTTETRRGGLRFAYRLDRPKGTDVQSPRMSLVTTGVGPTTVSSARRVDSDPRRRPEVDGKGFWSRTSFVVYSSIRSHVNTVP